MLELTPTLMLLVGITLILLILLGLLWANRRHQARMQATQYRTANGTLIDKQTRHIQSQPMATRRVRAGQVIPLARATPLHQVAVPPEDRLREIRLRGALAREHDETRDKGPRSASPYTLGTVEHSNWLMGYLGKPKTPPTLTVQTTARREDEPAAA